MSRFLSAIVRTVFAFAILVVTWAGLVWALPHGLVLLAVVAIVWYFVRTGELSRFNLRSLFVLATGVSVIVAICAFVPAPMLGGGAGVVTKRVVIQVLGKRGRSPIGNAEVILTSRAGNKTTKQENKTKADGSVVFTCECTAVTKKSILRTWTTFSTNGWSLDVMSPGYKPAKKRLSDAKVGNDGAASLNFNVVLEQEK